MSAAPYIHPYAKFKSETIRARAIRLCSQSLEILNDMAEWCEARKLPFVVTSAVSTPEEDKELCRISATHREARAFDVSIHGWIRVALQEFIAHFSQKYLAFAAYGGKTLEPELIVLHDNGHGEHMHVQVARVFAVKDPLEMLG